jgi:hypothetical protein
MDLHWHDRQLESSAAHPDRDRQFGYITEQRQVFGATGPSRISVDTRKKELIRQFKNAGRVWSKAVEAVNVHDFRPAALERAGSCVRWRGYVAVYGLPPMCRRRIGGTLPVRLCCWSGSRHTARG